MSSVHRQHDSRLLSLAKYPRDSISVTGDIKTLVPTDSITRR